MVLNGGEFPLEGQNVVNQLLVRKCYVDLSAMAMSFLERKGPTGEQIPGQIFLLRGVPGNYHYKSWTSPIWQAP